MMQLFKELPQVSENGTLIGHSGRTKNVYTKYKGIIKSPTELTNVIFAFYSDDGFRFTFHDSIIAESWQEQSVADKPQQSDAVDLEANTPYNFKLEHFQLEIRAQITMVWNVNAPNENDAATWHVVPYSYFYIDETTRSVSPVNKNDVMILRNVNRRKTGKRVQKGIVKNIFSMSRSRNLTGKVKRKLTFL